MYFLTLWERLPSPFFVTTLGLILVVIAVRLLTKEQIDVWQEEALLSRDGELNFGKTVDIDRDTAVVGVTASSVDSQNRGTVYIYTRSDSLWSLLVQVSSEDRDFGRAVAIDGDTLLIRASYTVSISTRTTDGWSPPIQLQLPPPPDKRLSVNFVEAVALDGNTVAVSADRNVYVFRRNFSNGEWVYEATLSRPLVSTRFRTKVAISGDTLIALGLDDGRAALYVFKRNAQSGAWSQQTTLRPLGGGIAIDGDTVVLGAPGIWPDGAAFVFQWDVETESWQQQARLVPQGARSPLNLSRYLFGYYFGSSVAIEGDVVVVGSGTIPISPLATHSNRSAAFIFKRNAASGRWAQQAMLIPEDKMSYRMPVAVSQDSVIVGDTRGSDRTNGLGAAYIFRRK